MPDFPTISVASNDIARELVMVYERLNEFTQRHQRNFHVLPNSYLMVCHLSEAEEAVDLALSSLAKFNLLLKLTINGVDDPGITEWASMTRNRIYERAQCSVSVARTKQSSPS